MKYLMISSKGELDPRLISLMGATTKRDDASKIGEFGTGLKYALAYLMFHNIDIKMFCGTTPVQLETKNVQVGENNWDVLWVNDQPTSITTTMCHKWNAWHVVREIYCNALDEGEAMVSAINGCVGGQPGYTTFYIQLVPDIQKVHDNWNRYFSTGLTPVFENSYGKAYLASTNELIVYRNGVRVFHKKDCKAVFHYDIPQLSINEMRECNESWEMSYEIGKLLMSMTSERWISYFLEAVLEAWEAGLDFDNHVDIQPDWSKAIGQAKIVSKSILSHYKDKLDLANLVCLTVPDALYSRLRKEFPHVSVLSESNSSFDYVEFRDNILDLIITEALANLSKAGYELMPDVKIKTAHFMNSRYLARAEHDNKQIIISERCKNLGVFDMACTIIEENEHLRTKHDDCSREFQNHFIRLYATELFYNVESIV